MPPMTRSRASELSPSGTNSAEIDGSEADNAEREERKEEQRVAGGHEAIESNESRWPTPPVKRREVQVDVTGGGRFEMKRRRIREALEADGVGSEIDALVVDMLGPE